MQLEVVNSLLCALSPADRNTLLDGARLVKLRRNRILYAQGERPTNAYFIQTGLASVAVETAHEEQAEAGMIGSEGVVGVTSILGPAANVTSCTLQLDSSAFEVSMTHLGQCFENNNEIRKMLLQFTQTYLLSTERLAACNRVHLAPERLVRWILMAQTYSQAGKLPFTHDFLAHMVAVQRTTVSAALNSLQAEGLLEHGWGSILIKDRQGLELKACSCYKVLKDLHFALYKKS